MRPSVAVRCFVELSNPLMGIWFIKQRRFRWHQESDREMDRINALTQIMLLEEIEQLDVVFHCGPRRERQERGTHRDARVVENLQCLDNIFFCMPLIDLSQDCFTD